MRKLGVMVLILFGAVMLLGNNYALAKGPHGDTWGKAHFNSMDTNNDGKISHDEYMAKCENRFKAMDTNKDGFLTGEECREAWEERKEQIREKREERRSHRSPGTSPGQVSPEESKSISD